MFHAEVFGFVESSCGSDVKLDVKKNPPLQNMTLHQHFLM